MSGSEGSKEKKRVVVVGGGIAGALLVKNLQQDADVILVDPKEYFEIPWAWLRSMVEPSFAERVVIDHTAYFKDGRLITDSAINISKNEVRTSDGSSIAFDYLVIATGHVDSSPLTRIERLAQFREDHHKITSAKSILIVGGGPTGVELAGEIATDFPDKKVTVVHRGLRLMEFLGSKASSKTLDWLTSKKVDVILEQTINFDSRTEEGIYQTSSGQTIAADCHFVCTGRKLGSSWLKDSALKDFLDHSGRLMVDEHLMVKGWKNVFAIGDITDIHEIKQGFFAQKHALVVAKNLKVLLKGEKETKMATYKPGKSMAIVSLGRKDAVAQLPIFTIIGCLPGLIKSKDLFVGKTRKQMGLEPHGEGDMIEPADQVIAAKEKAPDFC